jgi:hypothetical protein
MPKETISYLGDRLRISKSSIARFIGYFAAAASIIGISACRDGAKKKEAEKITALIEERLRDTALKMRVDACQTNVAGLMEKAKALSSSGDAKGAHETMHACQGDLTDKVAIELAKNYLNTYSIQLAKNAARQEAAERARKKKEGVRIGMSREDALASTWGKPKSINTTTTTRGTKEQWVYGGGSYLYFENGVLTTVQN